MNFLLTLLFSAACLALPFSISIAGQYSNSNGHVRATVTAEDCNKCHDKIVLALERKGKAHQGLCLDCHRGHPPVDMDIIPSCNRCHHDSSHFALDGCTECHVNPHTPLEIHLAKTITGPCLTCHTEQKEQLRANPSIHSKFDCTACHNFHGQIQPCQNCHLPHSDTMGEESCGMCHKAHMPLVVTYGKNIVPEFCGSCHDLVYTVMTENLTKHRKVSCVSCHVGNHGMIPACEICHDLPHPKEIHEKFNRCGECHGVAHDLLPTDYITNIFVKSPRDKKIEN